MQFQKAADEITNVLFALTKGFHLFCLLKHEPFNGLDDRTKRHSFSQGTADTLKYLLKIRNICNLLQIENIREMFIA